MSRRTIVLLVALAIAVVAGVAAYLLARRPIGAPVFSGRGPRPPARSEIEATHPELARAGVVSLVPVGGSGVSGTASLIELESGEGLRIELTLQGLGAGLHGIAIHELGDCAAPGDHYNPAKVKHSGPATLVGHAGDLGNIVASTTGPETRATLLTRRASLANGPIRVMGRSLVIHAGPDDLVTQPDGDAGAAVACGVITPAR